jgi:hypothetical protein
MHYYASGYYHAAKRGRIAHGRHAEPALASAPPKDLADANAQQVPRR